MRVLITGIGGFVGQHLSAQLQETVKHVELHGTVLSETVHTAIPYATLHTLDLKNTQAVYRLLDQLRPMHIYHLAAQSSPSLSRHYAWDTLENNILGQLNILQACLAVGIKPRILIVSSAEIYGAEDVALAEDSPLLPVTPYGVSKIAQDMLGLQYFLSDGLPIIRVRPFNHTGPGQREGFVAPDFAMQIARIEAGLQSPVLRVGSLEAQRDFTDVRDMVRAYSMIMEMCQPGEVYNVASQRVYSVRALLDILLSHTRQVIQVVPDPQRITKQDNSVKWGDASRLYAATGWQPTIPFEQTLLDLLNDCRQRVRGLTEL